MASLQQRRGWFHLLFRYQGRQHSHALKTKDRRQAEAFRGAVARLLIRIRNQEFPPPPAHADVAAYLLAGGKVADRSDEPQPATVTLKELADRYLDAHANGAMEANSLATARLHLNHVLAVLGGRFVTRDVTARVLQGYLDARGRDKGTRQKPLSPVTLKKEMSTVRAMWHWGVRVRMIDAAYPGRGLTYPKADQRPPFQTRDDIERKIARGGLTAEQIRALWDGWFLTKTDLAAFLAMAKAAAEPFLYPMLAFAAHTGARRSELMRMQIDDLDLDADSALIRERKRVRGLRSTRRVPLSAFLKDVLQGWLKRHPGGSHLFCVPMNRPGGSTVKALTAGDAKQGSRKLVRGTAWASMRGWHVLRHSFISICAAERVDQRVLQAWVGHMSAEMHARYTHLIPNVERQIITGVFGE